MFYTMGSLFTFTSDRETIFKFSHAYFLNFWLAIFFTLSP